MVERVEGGVATSHHPNLRVLAERATIMSAEELTKDIFHQGDLLL
jgi:hypothetical protein